MTESIKTKPPANIDETVNNISDFTQNVGTNLKNFTTDSSKVVQTELNSTLENANTVIKNPNIIFGLIIVIIIAIICTIIIYYFIMVTVFDKKSIVVEETKFPIKAFIKSVIPIEYFPTTSNGDKRAYTFWIYLNDNNTTHEHKHVLSFGKENVKLNIPYIYIDKDGILNVVLKHMENGFDPRNTFKFEYIPQQRWVHIGIVITDGGSGGAVTLYLDAEIVNVFSSNDKINDSSDALYDIKGLDLNQTGSLIIGGDSTNPYGFNGLISKVTIYNYDLNKRDIYNNYNQGPIDGLLASLGYGVRAPLYKLSG